MEKLDPLRTLSGSKMLSGHQSRETMATQFSPLEQVFVTLLLPPFLAGLFWLVVSGNSLLVAGWIDTAARKRHVRQFLGMLAFAYLMIGGGFLLGDFKAAHGWH